MFGLFKKSQCVYCPHPLTIETQAKLSARNMIFNSLSAREQVIALPFHEQTINKIFKEN